MIIPDEKRISEVPFSDGQLPQRSRSRSLSAADAYDNSSVHSGMLRSLVVQEPSSMLAVNNIE